MSEPATMMRRALPATAAGYASNADRAAADPIGLRGLPCDRQGLDGLVVALCRLLRGRGVVGLGGPGVARVLGLTGDRAVRLLVAYGQVHHGLREILGMVGAGYFWGPAVPEARIRMVGHRRKMGRCWLFKSALYRRGDVGSTVVQLAFDFMHLRRG